MTLQPEIRPFFHEPTSTFTYLAWDPATRAAAVIDPVLDFDLASGGVDTRSAAAVLQQANRLGLTVVWTLETHAHADHLSAARLIQARTGAKMGIGEHIRDVQRIFAPVFDATDVRPDGTDFDHLFTEGERFPLGALNVEVLHVPGHTPADIAYRIGDVVFVGDTLFMPDYGTARADFPGGDAHQLYHSIRRLLALPPATRLFLCHDYKASGRDTHVWQTTVSDQREHNVHVRDGVTEDEFVALRTSRDATLSAPALLLPSIQVNIRAGRFPPAAADGGRYLRIPVRLREGAVAGALGPA